MKKFFTLLLAVISTMTAFAQTEPAIELQAEVDGNTRTFTIGLGVEGTVQIDWGNGEKVTSEVIPAYDGYNQVNVFGTVSGDGKVKIYAGLIPIQAPPLKSAAFSFFGNPCQFLENSLSKPSASVFFKDNNILNINTASSQKC